MASSDSTMADIIQPTDPAIDYQAREKLIGARVSLLLKQPFFGNLATRLKLVNADMWCQTLATDGRNFYYNSRFVMMLDQKEIEFGFGHEILHCVYDHFGRQMNRNKRIWNLANDYCVNADLIKHEIGRKITTIKILHDPQFNDMASEEVYDKLMENVQYIDIEQLTDMLLDEHLDGQGDSGGEGVGEGEGDEGKGNGRPKLSKEDRAAIRDEFREAVINSAMANGLGAGNLPGNVKKMIGELTQPQMDWRELLNLTLTSTVKTDYSWRRPSRRAFHMDAILPCMDPGEAIDIAVAIDTSGSISSTMLKDFLGEVQGAMESFAAYKIHLFCFDTAVHNPVNFTSDDINELTEYELGGFGGTAFEPIFQHLKDAEVTPERLVVFTDMCPSSGWGDPDYCDTLWINHSNPGTVAPFGTTVEYTAA